MTIKEFTQLNNISTYPLYPLGIDGYAYIKKDALLIIHFFRDNCFPITGGNVYTISKEKICYTEGYNGWSCDRLQNEPWNHYVRRSYEIAYKYINSYSRFPALFNRKEFLFSINYVETPDDYNDIYPLVNEILAKWNPINVPQNIADNEYLSYVPYIVDSIDDDIKLRSCLLSVLRNMGFEEDIICQKNIREDIDKLIKELKELRIGNHRDISCFMDHGVGSSDHLL